MHNNPFITKSVRFDLNETRFNFGRKLKTVKVLNCYVQSERIINFALVHLESFYYWAFWTDEQIKFS